MHFSRLTLLAIAGALLVPSAAAAATPPVITFTDAVKGKPAYTWTNGPAGEYLEWITISPSNETELNGNLRYVTGQKSINGLSGINAARLERSLHAGTYFWNGYWRHPDILQGKGYTPVQSFEVPKVLKGLKGKYTQYSHITAFSANGTFVSNAKTAKVTCRIYKGKKTLSKQTQFISNVTPYAKTNFYCSDLKVSERYDGKRLRLNVLVKSGGKTKKANKFFRAI